MFLYISMFSCIISFYFAVFCFVLIAFVLLTFLSILVCLVIMQPMTKFNFSHIERIVAVLIKMNDNRRLKVHFFFPPVNKYNIKCFVGPIGKTLPSGACSNPASSVWTCALGQYFPARPSITVNIVLIFRHTSVWHHQELWIKIEDFVLQDVWRNID